MTVKHLRKALQTIFPGRKAAARGAATVLVVDDEPLVVQGLAAILNSEGFTVLTAFDAESALRLVQKASPQLLISDVNMPGMDGIELAMRLVTALPTLRVLLFSADFANLEINFAHRVEHHFSLLAKPVHPRRMLEEVRATLEGTPQPGRAKAHTAATEHDHVVIGSRPRSNRSVPLPTPPEPVPEPEAPEINSHMHPIDARLSARRYFLKTAESQARPPLPRAHRPTFFERSSSPRMSRDTPTTKPSLSLPPATQSFGN